jgi:hypothetical protein
MCRPVLPVYNEVRRIAAEGGMTMRQYVADVLAVALGRPDLVRELDQQEEELPLLAM